MAVPKKHSVATQHLDTVPSYCDLCMSNKNVRMIHVYSEPEVVKAP